MAANSSRLAEGSKGKASSGKPRKRRKKGDLRPKKPVGFPDFPLYAHPLGYWSKKVNGEILHFGRWGRVVNGKLTPLPYDASWREAYANFKARIDDPNLGRGPGTVVTAERPDSGECTLGKLCDHFLDAKRQRLKSGEIGQRMYDEYKSITDLLIEKFGAKRLVDDLVAKDFEALRDAMDNRWGPVRLGNGVTRVKTVFKYGYETGLVEKPVRFGPEFVKPSASVLRKHRAKNGKRMLTANECQKLLAAADAQMKAMLLLGLNCGFGNHDVATLPLEVLDLEKGWIDFPRPKSGIERRCPLWVETVLALKAAIAERKKPKQEDAEGLVFVTLRGRPWLSRGIANPVSVAARTLFKDCGVNGRRGVGFYTLRHVFRTIADGARDQVAANLIMGHSDPTMAAVYREHIGDDRLQAVVRHVHEWLFRNGGDT